jgi:hypothetical protein
MGAEEAERLRAVEALEDLVARAELGEASRPHTILVWDSEVRSSYAYGVYPTAFAAVEDSEKIRTEASQEVGAGGVRVLIIPIYDAPGADP